MRPFGSMSSVKLGQENSQGTATLPLCSPGYSGFAGELSQSPAGASFSISRAKLRAIFTRGRSYVSFRDLLARHLEIVQRVTRFHLRHGR